LKQVKSSLLLIKIRANSRGYLHKLHRVLLLKRLLWLDLQLQMQTTRMSVRMILSHK